MKDFGNLKEKIDDVALNHKCFVVNLKKSFNREFF